MINSEEIVAVLKMIGKKARRASAALAVLPPEAKSGCLNNMADALIANSEKIAVANAVDIDNARKAGMDAAKIDRLLLTGARINAMADGLRQVAGQHDPVGRVLSENIRPNG